MKINNSVTVAYQISIAIIAFLLVGAIWFYRERMLFIDPAFITFEIINKKTFIFSEHRYGAFFTQGFPLVGLGLGLSIKSIMVLYSASFYVFFLLVAYISGSILKQYKYAIMLALYLIVFVSDVYFWPNNEIHQAIAWMILFLGLFQFCVESNWRNPMWMHPLLIVSLFLATNTHLLVVMPLVFMWIFQYLNESDRLRSNSKYILQYSILISLFIGFRLWLSYNSWYDGVKLNGVKQASANSIFDALLSDHSKSFVKLVFSRYWIIFILVSVGFYSMISRKKYFLFGFTLLSAVAYYIIVTLTYSTAITDNNLYYFESQWMCWAIILCTPFVFVSLKSIKRLTYIYIIFTVLLMSKILPLSSSIDRFKNRLTSLENLVQQAKEKNTTKAYLYNSDELNNQLLLTWGLPIESMLLSAIEKDSIITNVVVIDKNSTISSAQDSIYTAFKLRPISDVNSNYFTIDKGNTYILLKD